MRIAVGSDHAGFPLKQTIIQAIEAAGDEAIDLGTFAPEPPVDYPDYAERVAAAILSGRADRGILCCGSGIGASIAANKIHGIRAAVAHDVYSAHQGVEHDAMNVLCVGARIIGTAVADEVVRSFLGAEFTGEERHRRRLAKITQLEQRGAP
ncbi:MAG TPA: ribose 5-phosphate isomerase B, partial [Chloroflexota bacterium]|nr:ribose 5-phosphate isomerase B [Chloroflexota bacterium]